MPALRWFSPSFSSIFLAPIDLYSLVVRPIAHCEMEISSEEALYFAVVSLQITTW
jgi:hypothetical protein